MDNGFFKLGDPNAHISCNGYSGSTVFGPVQIDYIGPLGRVSIYAHLLADLTVTQMDGQLTEWGHVGSAAQGVNVTINDMPTPPSGLTFLDLCKATLNFPQWPCSFYGDLLLQSGVEEFTRAVLHGFLESGSSINLNNQDVAGSLRIWLGGTGTIVNGGAVTSTGIVNLGWANPFPVSFSGTATFASVSNGGSIRTQSSADLDGTVHITGDMAGDINLGFFTEPRCPSDLLANGEILVDGNATGNITVDGNVEGDIVIGGNASGSTGVGATLKTTGRILVDGMLYGDITVAEETVDLSLIRVTDGMEDDAVITINDGRGNFNANGTIHVGAVSFPIGDVTF